MATTTKAATLSVEQALEIWRLACAVGRAAHDRGIAIADGDAEQLRAARVADDAAMDALADHVFGLTRGS